MKKITLSLVCLMITVTVFGQSWIIRDHSGTDITDTTFVISGDDATLEEAFTAENTTADTITTMLKRYEIDVVENTLNYFCWVECYAPVDAGEKPLWLGIESIKMGPAEIDASSHVYHVHNNHGGKSTYLYVYYDVNNPNDSVFVNVVFDVPEEVGVQELSVSELILDAGPNPASEKISINYQLNRRAGDKASIVIVDLLGKMHGEYNVQNKQGKINIDVSDFMPGIYFYSLQVDGRLILTKKLIVN